MECQYLRATSVQLTYCFRETGRPGVALALFFSFAVLQPPALAQTETPGYPAIDQLAATVANLHDDDPMTSQVLTRTIETLREDIVDLQQGLGSAQLSRSYESSLAADRIALQNTDKGLDAPANLSVLYSVQDDLNDKIRSMRDSLGFGGPSGGDLSVVVYTIRQNGKVISGLLVRANSAGLPDEDPPDVIFNQVSSPTSAEMAPGKYRFLVRTSDQAKPLLYQWGDVVGAQGAQVPIDLVIPGNVVMP